MLSARRWKLPATLAGEYGILGPDPFFTLPELPQLLHCPLRKQNEASTRLRALIVNGEVPRAVEEVRVIQREHKGSIAIEELERSLLRRRDIAGISDRQVPYHDEAARKGTQGGAQSDERRRGKEGLLARRSNADDGGSRSLSIGAVLEIRHQHVSCPNIGAAWESGGDKRQSVGIHVTLRRYGGRGNALQRIQNRVVSEKLRLSASRRFDREERDHQWKYNVCLIPLLHTPCA